MKKKILDGKTDFAKKELSEAKFLIKTKQEAKISRYLENTLDKGEAAVIQTAIDMNISSVCIDEAVGRRIARLHGLKLTGSIGILIIAKHKGFEISITDAINKMHSAGIWLSDKLMEYALNIAGE